MTRILGLSKDEAAKRLEQGDIGFIQDSELPDSISEALSRLRPLSRVKPHAAFFSAVLAESAETRSATWNRRPSSLLYAIALEDTSAVVRRESCVKLMFPVLNGDEDFAREIINILNNRSLNDDEQSITLIGACFYRLGLYAEALKNLEDRKGSSSWNTALCFLSMYAAAGEQAAKKTAAEAVNFFLTAPVDSVWEWAFARFGDELILELSAMGLESSTNNSAENSAGDPLEKPVETGLFTRAEKAAFLARAAVSRSQYTRSLGFFNICLAEAEAEATGEKYIPGKILFFKYPQLLGDMGRAFQFASGGSDDGLRLFASWEEQLRAKAVDSDPVSAFLLPYYSGRILRQNNRYDESTAAFERALELAPDNVQADACIWYILINVLRESPQSALRQFQKYIPLMYSAPYFSDVLDRLSQSLTKTRNWKGLEDIFTLLNNGRMLNAAPQYAWILGRAVEENYFQSSAPGPGAADYFRIIYNNERASLYYRAMSAYRLGAALVPDKIVREDRRRFSPEAEFLLGFFDFGAASFALPFIRRYEESLSVPELRLLSDALAKEGRTNESINLVSRYMARDDYSVTREDLRLHYPKPFQELVEKYSKDAGIGPELLFAVIRTESYFMPAAVSRVGAVGLCQLMPDTASDMAARIARRTGPDYRSGGRIALEDAETSIHIGSFYLNYLTENMSSPMTTLLAYNGGMGRVRRWRAAENLPDDLFLETVEYEETREFGRRVSASAAVYGYLYYGMSMEDVFADIYDNEHISGNSG